MTKQEKLSVSPGAKKFLKKEVEYELLAKEHEKFLEERSKIADKYKIIGGAIEKLEYKDGHWYFGGIRVEDLDDLDDMSGLPNYTGQK